MHSDATHNAVHQPLTNKEGVPDDGSCAVHKTNMCLTDTAIWPVGVKQAVPAALGIRVALVRQIHNSLMTASLMLCLAQPASPSIVPKAARWTKAVALLGRNPVP